jgi:hypothetical protein
MVGRIRVGGAEGDRLRSPSARQFFSDSGQHHGGVTRMVDAAAASKTDVRATVEMRQAVQ